MPILASCGVIGVVTELAMSPTLQQAAKINTHADGNPKAWYSESKPWYLRILAICIWRGNHTH